MPFGWHALHAGLRVEIARHGSLVLFRRLAGTAPVLARFSEPAALLEHQHPGQDPEAGDAVIRALVAAAQADSPVAELARTLLLLALWPGLDAIRGRMARFGRDDDLGQDLVARLLDRVMRMDLDGVTRVAATLLMNVNRDMVTARRAVASRAAEPFDEELHGLRGQDADRVTSEVALDRRRLPQRLRQVLGADAELVLAVAVAGFRQQEAGAVLGLAPDAARKRYQRAIGRLEANREII